MAEPKKPKTPANSADKGVADGGDEVRTFKSGGLAPIAAVDDDGNRIGSIADVAFFSGLFPGETPATLAIKILAGQSLGLDPAQALFDLVIGPGPAIAYRPGHPFEKANDDVEATKAANMKALENSNDDRTTSEPASPPAGRPGRCPRCDSPSPERHPAMQAEGEVQPCPDPFHVMPDNVVHLLPPTGTAVPINEGDKITVTRGPAADPAEPSKLRTQESDTNANAGPSPIAAAPPSPTPPDVPGDTRAADTDEARAESKTPAEDGPGPATPDPAASAEPVSDELAAAWREAVVSMLREMEYSNEAIRTRLDNFDVADAAGKRKILDDCQTFYKGKVDAARAKILEALGNDGKATFDQQKGFFLFADVPLDPFEWSFSETRKADAALKNFLARK